MNRYQFEDLISEYIENELSLSKRKAFETYMDENPDAKSLVDSVRTNMTQMNSISKVVASTEFNDRLLAKIQTEHARLDRPIPAQRTFFGFTPVHASLMTGLVVAFIFVGMQLFTPDGNVMPTQPRNFAQDQVPALSKPNLQNVNSITPDLAEAEEDSALDESQTKSQKDFSKKIHFVND